MDLMGALKEVLEESIHGRSRFVGLSTHITVTSYTATYLPYEITASCTTPHMSVHTLTKLIMTHVTEGMERQHE